MNNEVYSYITREKTAWRTTRVPLTNSKDWNMSEHIERCLNVANAWYHTGKNDGLRPYNDIVTPIIDVAFRLEGFDVKDIYPYIDDSERYYMSFLIRKYHPQWARKNELDTFIDEVVESSIIYDLVVIKDINEVRPEVIKLQDIAFCDQTDILSGPICLKHNYTIPQLLEYSGKWYPDKIDECIVMASASKEVSTANDSKVSTPGKYIEVYELHGSFPETWLDPEGDKNKYVPQIHIVTFYKSSDGIENGITLYKGKSKKLTDIFKALKIDQVRSHGRACGRSLVERLFDPQVWNNYSAIKIKKMLDSAVNLLQTDSEEYGNKKISELKENTVLKHEPGRPITKVDMGIQNLTAFENQMSKTETQARILGSASEAALGINPTSGTPFALQDLIVNQGEGIHTYRQGKIATFFADVLYRDLFIKYLVKDMNNGKKFSEELTLDELHEIVDNIVTKQVNQRIKEGNVLTPEKQKLLTQLYKESFLKGGKRRFMEALQSELNDIESKVLVNIVGKQKNLAKDADKLTNLIREVIANPMAFKQVPGLAKLFNSLVEDSGFSPIDFTQITIPEVTETSATNQETQPESIPSPIQSNNLSTLTTNK